jgi:AcrR family transcriptional regulator
MASDTPRDRLLDAVIEHFSEDGLGDQSLRRIADAVGSSHRMLLYHFGSKDGLLLAVAREVEARTQVRFAALAAASGGASDELIRLVWTYVSDPGLADLERLFFTLYTRALQGDPALEPLLEGDIAGWLEANAALAEGIAPDVRPEVARTHARLGVAVVRGLLLDLLATGDRVEVNAALETFARHYAGRWWEDGPSADTAERRSAQPAGTSDRAS